MCAVACAWQDELDNACEHVRVDRERALCTSQMSSMIVRACVPARMLSMMSWTARVSTCVSTATVYEVLVWRRVGC